ncbi:uncharacterized protein LOC110847407 [Folsomia candida]|nr:uncharacterized protein LOC110847407 [Folsomia candida]
MSSFIWTAFMIVVLIALVVFLIKFLLCNCMLSRGEDSIPIIPGQREAFWIEYDRLRTQAMMARQPPPDFDEALRSSRPVSYVEVVEEPPPTYDDFLKSQTPSPTNSSPVSQGTNFSTSSGQSNAIVVNPFEDDFVFDLSAQESDIDLGEVVFGRRTHISQGTRNPNTESSDA